MTSNASITLLFIKVAMAEVVAKSLLEKLQYPPSAATRKRIKESFSLGMEDWDSDDSDFEPLTRTNRKCDGESPKRFVEPTSSEVLERTSKGVVPKNTQKSDQWAQRALAAWITERNKRCNEKCPMDILETEDAESLAKWLSLFVIELRKKDGSKYPPASIHLILCGLQRIIRRNNSHPFDIFDKKDVCFRDFRGTMETTYQDLHKEGIGVEIKHAPIISGDEEVILWERKILGCHSPTALVRAVFFLNGKNFLSPRWQRTP